MESVKNLRADFFHAFGGRWDRTTNAMCQLETFPLPKFRQYISYEQIIYTPHDSDKQSIVDMRRHVINRQLGVFTSPQAEL
eukprot:3976455-Pleurochrysis_carterae.AAC.6